MSFLNHVSKQKFMRFLTIHSGCETYGACVSLSKFSRHSFDCVAHDTASHVFWQGLKHHSLLRRISCEITTKKINTMLKYFR